MFVVGALRNVKFIFGLTLAIASASAQTPAAAQARGKFVRQYCIGCHSERLKPGAIVLENVDAARVSGDAGVWERVLLKVRTGQMPPAGLPRPEAPVAENRQPELAAEPESRTAAANDSDPTDVDSVGARVGADLPVVEHGDPILGIAEPDEPSAAWLAL